MRTAFADNLIGENASKEVLDNILIRSSFHLVFKAIEQDPRKFIDIHLLMDISGESFVVLESMAEICRSVEFPLTVDKIVEHFLHLEQHIFVIFFLPIIRVLALKKSFSKFRDHKELLEETIHVASASQVLQPYISACRFYFVSRSQSPIIKLSTPPQSLFVLH